MLLLHHPKTLAMARTAHSNHPNIHLTSLRLTANTTPHPDLDTNHLNPRAPPIQVSQLRPIPGRHRVHLPMVNHNKVEGQHTQRTHLHPRAKANILRNQGVPTPAKVLIHSKAMTKGTVDHLHQHQGAMAAKATVQVRPQHLHGGFRWSDASLARVRRRF